MGNDDPHLYGVNSVTDSSQAAKLIYGLVVDVSINDHNSLVKLTASLQITKMQHMVLLVI